MSVEIQLFLDSVLSHIECNGSDDDETLDDECHLVVDTHHDHAVVDNAHDQDTGDNTGGTADTTSLGSTTDGCCCDSIKLVVQTCVCRVCGVGTACKEDAAESCAEGAPHVNFNQSMLNVDTCNSCCLIITTDCIDGLTKSGHLQHECQDDEHDDHDDNDHVERTNLAVAEETEAGSQFGNGTGSDQFAERTADQLCTQSSDEGMQMKICNHITVCKTDDQADRDTAQDTWISYYRSKTGCYTNERR